MHIMIDLETLSTRVDAVILSIGAVKFDENKIIDDFYAPVQKGSQPGRRIDQSTLDWWKEQSPEAFNAAFFDPNAMPLRNALAFLANWVDPDAKIWANSPDFDCSILAHAYGDQGVPWKFYNTRCLRTMRELAPQVDKPTNTCVHDALADATAQAKHLQAIWAAL